MVLILIASNLFTFMAVGAYYRRQEPVPPPHEEPQPEEPARQDDLPAELKPLVEVLDILSARFLTEVSREELVVAGIRGMVASLDDPQTYYLAEDEWKEIMIKVDGTFSGIGVEITSVDGFVTVVAPIKNTPGERAGLLPGDRIIRVDGQEIIGFSTLEAAKLMRGPAGSPAVLEVERDGFDELLRFEIIRENIVVPTVFSELWEDGIGYLQITSFTDNTGEDFQEALLELETKGLRGLLLDLRDNPGGLLTEAIKIGQEIVPPGPITHVVDGKGTKLETYTSYGTEKPYPIVVLVNGASASAAEIIAGALQDTGAGTLVGTRTFGKATVQHLEKISGNAGLSYTIAKYQTPLGRDIHGHGLEPDYGVELPEDFYFLRYGMLKDVAPGTKEPAVFYLQKTLNALGYSLTETGIYDSETEAAVHHFQRQNGLPATGSLNQETRSVLAEKTAAVLEELDTQKQKAREVLLEKMK
ncbi:MAG TPA: PDZ domain-containing protein [Firmicutes bacterium]|nr:PDZ domain-containing protein [Bacillota bacterium]